MDLLTIGAFARATGLSPKALRLYDRLGLLRPAVVDPRTGYRLYRPDQLEPARLVAWLRRLGMPLARIAAVATQPRAVVAREVLDHWHHVEADVATRRALVTFLVDHLSEEDKPMTDVSRDLLLRGAARTDQGLVRAQNRDLAYAGEHLVAVADGFGVGGERASTAAIDALLAHPPTAGDVLGTLQEAARHAAESVHALPPAPTSGDDDLGVDHLGTTLTALGWSGDQLALIHIGDTRAYLLRDGALTQLTHDHTVVQSMIDNGTLTAAEAESHPRRAVLHRALHRASPSRPDSLVQEARVADRYLISSDGLHAVLPDDVLRTVLVEVPDPERALDELVRRVHAAGAPDNVAIAIADVLAA